MYGRGEAIELSKASCGIKDSACLHIPLVLALLSVKKNVIHRPTFMTRGLIIIERKMTPAVLFRSAYRVQLRQGKE